MGSGQRHEAGSAVQLWQLALLCLVVLAPSIQAEPDLHQQCQTLADTYLSHHMTKSNPYTGDNLVFFLHVPRTAGRTFHSCLLKLGTRPNKLCPKAYDHLRINTSVPNCQLLTSHDDFSVVASLPEGVSVLTQLRDPVDRFLSAYEFAVEVGMRSCRESTGRKTVSASANANAVLTENVWPWSFLAPFMARDMYQRIQERRNKGTDTTDKGGNWITARHPNGQTFYHNCYLRKSVWNLTDAQRAAFRPPLDPYDNPLVMSLAEFVRHPIAEELLHNGQTYQVLGLTNYSHWGDAAEMRRCMEHDDYASSHMLEVAQRRLEDFIHVGATNKLKDSVASAAAALHFSLNHGQAFTNEQEKRNPRGGNAKVEKPLPLGASFLKCARGAQASNAKRRDKSLNSLFMSDGRRIFFSKEARGKIPKEVIDEIKRRNRLDIAMHSKAEQLLAEHNEMWAGQGKLETLPAEAAVKAPLPPVKEMAKTSFEGFPLP